MPDFIRPLTIRYALITLAAYFILIGGTMLLSVYQVIDGTSSNNPFLTLFPGAYYAGMYFAKQTGRVVEWPEARKISVVLMVVQVIISLLLMLVYVYLVDPDLIQAITRSTDITVMVVIFTVFMWVLYWLVTAYFMRMASKVTLISKTA